MSDVDKLQTAEEEANQRIERGKAAKREADREALREEPLRDTALKLRRPRDIAASQIHPGDNVRLDLPEIAELARSIREVGLLSPLIVRPWDTQTDGSLPAHAESGKDHYRLIGGHRRLAALEALTEAGVKGWDTVACEVREGLSEAEAYALMLTENVQRVALEPMQAARALRLLLDLNEGLDAATLARSIGMKPAWAQTHLKLLDLPQEVLDRIEAGDLSVTIADLLRRGQSAGRIDERRMVELADRAAKKTITVAELRAEAGPKRNTVAPRTVRAGEIEGSATVIDAPLRPNEHWREGNPNDPFHETYDRPATPLQGGSSRVPGAAATAASGDTDIAGLAPAQQVPMEVQLDIYLLGRALREWAADDYLDELGIDRAMTDQYAAALDFEERIEAIRRLSHTLMQAERQPAAV